MPGFERAAREVELTAGFVATVGHRPADRGTLRGGHRVGDRGLAIEAPAINMPHAVTVVSRETLEQQGGRRNSSISSATLTSLRRIPAMNNSPAITASSRPRSAATWSDSPPRPRLRGRWQVASTAESTASQCAKVELS